MVCKTAEGWLKPLTKHRFPARLAIIKSVFRLFAVILVSLLMLPGCANKMQSKEKVQAAILDRLQSHSGLDLNSLDVTTTSVSFDKNKAYATVAFHPKGDPTVNGGMTMKYTLQEQGGKWVVVNVGDTQGHPVAGGQGGPPAEQLPPGHPGVNAMPPDHPSLDSVDPNTGRMRKEGSNGRPQ